MVEQSPMPGGREGGLLTRMGSRLSRFFRSDSATAQITALGALGCAAQLSGKSGALFSVFPASEGEAEETGQPTQGFCQHLTAALDTSLRHPEGPRVVGLLGAGGSGKSTLFNELVGSRASRVVRLGFMAPDAVKAILQSQQSQALTANDLSHRIKLPNLWNEQTSVLAPE